MGSVGATNCGTTPLRSHRTYRISPHPGGVGGAYQGGTAPSTSGRGLLRRGCGLDNFPPREPTQGWPTMADLAPRGGGEPAYVPRPPPTPLCYILEYVGREKG